MKLAVHVLGRDVAVLEQAGDFRSVLSYHADTVALGALAERAGVPHVLLTHLIPPPEDDADEAAFAADLRDGGYRGAVTVGRDLVTVTVPAAT